MPHPLTQICNFVHKSVSTVIYCWILLWHSVFTFFSVFLAAKTHPITLQNISALVLLPCYPQQTCTNFPFFPTRPCCTHISSLNLSQLTTQSCPSLLAIARNSLAGAHMVEGSLLMHHWNDLLLVPAALLTIWETCSSDTLLLGQDCDLFVIWKICSFDNTEPVFLSIASFL